MTRIAAIAILCVSRSLFGADRDDDQKPPSNPIVSRPGPAMPVDKSSYTLFNPTPADQMRGFNTDRPSVTESPYTVDAGHFQVELSFLEYTHDDDRGDRRDQFSAVPSALRVGLLNNLEFDLSVVPYLNILAHGREASRRDQGFGDIEMRTKLNLWGNDGGGSAGGVIPFLRFPTASDGLSSHHVEGGLILPLAFDLPAGFEAGTMAECDINRNASNTDYGVDFVHTFTVGHELVEGVSAYVEYVGISPIRTGNAYLAYFDTGITFAIGKDVQLDTGINIGLSRRADDFTVFAGISFRL